MAGAVGPPVTLLPWLLLVGFASAAPIQFAPNLDDDDGNGRVDWLDEWPDPAENDWLSLELPATGGHLSLEGDVANTRIWLGSRLILGQGLPQRFPVPAGATVQVELGSWLTEAQLVFSPTRGAEARWHLKAAPIVLPHPLRPVERTWVMPMPDGEEEASNVDLLAALEEHAPRAWEPVHRDLYDGDRWVQDQFEVAWAAGVYGPMRVIIDSPRDGLVGAGGAFLAEELAREPDTALLYFSGGGDTAIDGFGNLEVTPPLGPDLPHGRILTGRSLRQGLQPELLDLLRRTGEQAPLELDTSWLWVGHVDELVAFVPDAAAPRGFRALLPSSKLGLRALDQLDPSVALARYAQTDLTSQEYPTAGSMQADSELHRYNLELERERLVPLRRHLAEELSLQRGEIGLVPALFVEAVERGSIIPRASALVPNLLNLMSFPDERGAVVLTADPWMRPPGAAPSADPFVRGLLRALPPGVRVRLVDTWEPYHQHDGGVHCATNVQRAPSSAAHRLPQR